MLIVVPHIMKPETLTGSPAAADQTPDPGSSQPADCADLHLPELAAMASTMPMITMNHRRDQAIADTITMPATSRSAVIPRAVLFAFHPRVDRLDGVAADATWTKRFMVFPSLIGSTCSGNSDLLLEGSKEDGTGRVTDRPLPSWLTSTFLHGSGFGVFPRCNPDPSVSTAR